MRKGEGGAAAQRQACQPRAGPAGQLPQRLWAAQQAPWRPACCVAGVALQREALCAPVQAPQLTGCRAAHVPAQVAALATFLCWTLNLTIALCFETMVRARGRPRPLEPKPWHAAARPHSQLQTCFTAGQWAAGGGCVRAPAQVASLGQCTVFLLFAGACISGCALLNVSVCVHAHAHVLASV